MLSGWWGKLEGRLGKGGRMLVAVAALAVLGAGAAGWMRKPAQDMQTVQVARATIESSVTALGTLQPRRYVDVGAQVSGQILRRHVQPGAVVEKGAGPTV